MSVYNGHGCGAVEEGKELCGDGGKGSGNYGMDINKRGEGLGRGRQVVAWGRDDIRAWVGASGLV